MKKKWFSLAAPGAVGYMILSNLLTAHASGRNVNIPTDQVHYYMTKNGNVCYLLFQPEEEDHITQPPLLLVHDLYPGFSAEEWRAAAKILSKNRLVYAIDLPGCGRSDKTKLSYTQYLFVQVMNQFVRDITGKGIDVITSGSSFSAAILADRMDPDAFRKIIAVNPPDLSFYRKYPGFPQKMTRSLLRTPVFGTHIYNLKFSKTATTDRLLNFGFYNPEKLSPDFVKTIYQTAHYDHQQAKHLYSGIASRYMNLDITDSLRLYIKKLYFVMGSAYSNYREIYRSYQDQVPNTGLCVIGKTAKYPHLEEIEKFCRMMQRLSV